MPWKDKTKKRAYERRYRQRPEVRDRQRPGKRAWAKSEKGRAYRKAYDSANPDKVRAWKRKTIYGIDAEAWNALFDAQDRSCAFCKSTFSGGRGWSTDHDHNTSRVRWILCHGCNLGLGHFKDNSELLRRVADMLDAMVEVGEVPE